MTEHDPFEALLREADAGAGAPPRVPADLARRVATLARRRKTRRRTGGAAAMVLAVAGTGVFWANRSARVVTSGDEGIAATTEGMDSELASAADLARLRAEVEWLRAEAEAYKRLADRLLWEREEREAMARVRRRIDERSRVDPIDEQLDRAALTMMRQADRLRGELNLPASAAERYRRVIELFGGTRWAPVAQDRLTEMKASSGDVL